MLKTWLVESRFLGRVRTKRPLTRPDKSGHPLPLGTPWERAGGFLRFLPSPLGPLGRGWRSREAGEPGEGSWLVGLRQSLRRGDPSVSMGGGSTVVGKTVLLT